MRRGLAWAAGLAGLLTAFLLRRRSSGTTSHEDPAVELRRKLAAAREAEPAAEASTPPVEESAPSPDADGRRREVHEQARAAIDEMRRSDG